LEGERWRQEEAKGRGVGELKMLEIVKSGGKTPKDRNLKVKDFES